MSDEYICKKCGEYCKIEGDYPEYYCYCENCKGEPEGWDSDQYSTDLMAYKIDQAKEIRKYGS